MSESGVDSPPLLGKGGTYIRRLALPEDAVSQQQIPQIFVHRASGLKEFELRQGLFYILVNVLQDGVGQSSTADEGVGLGYRFGVAGCRKEARSTGGSMTYWRARE